MAIPIPIQLDLFEDYTEIDILRKEIQAIKDSQDRQRKRLFAQDADLMKMILKQGEEIDRLKEMVFKIEKMK